jgi:hypothetical protein
MGPKLNTSSEGKVKKGLAGTMTVTIDRKKNRFWKQTTEGENCECDFTYTSGMAETEIFRGNNAHRMNKSYYSMFTKDKSSQDASKLVAQ